MEVEYSLKVMSHKEREQTGFVTDAVARPPQIVRGHGGRLPTLSCSIITLLQITGRFKLSGHNFSNPKTQTRDLIAVFINHLITSAWGKHEERELLFNVPVQLSGKLAQNEKQESEFKHEPRQQMPGRQRPACNKY